MQARLPRTLLAHKPAHPVGALPIAIRTVLGLRVQGPGAIHVPRRQFTDTALSLSMTLLNAGIDLISFSGILYSIYPPLFVALVVDSVGGTGASLFLGRKLVGLNFAQEAQEANFRCARPAAPKPWTPSRVPFHSLLTRGRQVINRSLP